MYRVVLLNPRGVDIDTKVIEKLITKILEDKEITDLAEVSLHRPQASKELGICLESEDVGDLDEAVDLLMLQIPFPDLKQPWKLRSEFIPETFQSDDEN